MEYEHEHERALIFLQRKDTVHVSKVNGEWFNGLILEVGSNFFIIRDRVENRDKMVLFNELKKPLELFKEP